MGDLRHNRTRLAELADFILKREGFDPYFYCDSNGFVTIGIGTLVAKEDDARRIARDPAVHFTFQNDPRQRATADDVAADWRRVHERPGLPERAYRNVAQLRLEAASVHYLMRQEIARSADSLYRLHPFLLSFDSRVAMALVDTRYNPAGINPYRSPQTKALWAALDPNRPQFNLKTALALFEPIWTGRGGRLAKRYASRHQHRVQWMREGLEAMGSTSGGLVCVPD